MKTVKLGDRVFPVVAQRHARLRNRLSGKDFEAIMSKDYAIESYRVLCILIPALEDMPLWEFEGYASSEDMEEKNYQEDTDKSPTSAEIVDAFEAALMVSGADRLGKIVSLIQATTNLTQNETSTDSLPITHGNSGE